MAQVADIVRMFDNLAPFNVSYEDDNIGLLVGNPAADVKKIIICLDITLNAAREAVECGADLIISHHPVIYRPVRSVVCGNATGEIIHTLIAGHVSALCLHTNLDICRGGVNDKLAEALELKNVHEIFKVENLDACIGRIGEAKEMSLKNFALFVKKKLNCNGVRYYDAGRSVKNVAVVGGSGGDFVADAYKAGADTLVTGEAKHHEALLAVQMGINLIAAGHHATEYPVTRFIRDSLKAAFPDVELVISKSDTNIEMYA